MSLFVLLLCTVVNCSLFDNKFEHCTNVSMADKPTEEEQSQLESQPDQRPETHETEAEQSKEQTISVNLETSESDGDGGVCIQADTASVVEPNVVSKDDKDTKSEEKDEDEGDYKFPKTLEEFGYTFKDGKLRTTGTDEPFVFEVRKGEKKYNQKHYEAIGEIITEYVYKLLETETHLNKIILPIDASASEPKSFFFASDNFQDNPDKLMILIHGSGVVRAGQWARRLIMNDCLESGTQLPYIKEAVERGYSIIVLNGNRNFEEKDGKKVAIRENSSPEEHAKYVWKNFVKKSSAKRIDIVAHSYGGVVTVELIKAELKDFQKRVHKIAFTDSVHDFELQNVPSATRRWITGCTVNWVSSPHELDKEVNTKRRDVPRVSAGTTEHIETSHCSFQSIFKYFD